MKEFKIERDPAVFGPHQWHITELPGVMFSSEHDATQAVKLARWVERETAADIRQMIGESY